MKLLSTDMTVGQIVAEEPRRSRVFERAGIDYCCGGRRTLIAACQAKGLSADTLLQEILAEDDTASGTTAGSAADWGHTPLAALCDHIVETHHAYLQAALPRLSALTEKVASAHGSRDPRLCTLRDVFAAFRTEMEEHTRKEEAILFPLIGCLDASPISYARSVAQPIAVMTAEHDAAGAALAEMRNLTDGYTPPPNACNTYRALLAALAELEADTHRHVHKENHILFPRALEYVSPLVAAGA